MVEQRPEGRGPLEGISRCPSRTEEAVMSSCTHTSWGLLTCSVSPKESLWMTWVMSGFCGWAVALCVDTWKLPGTWGRDESLGAGLAAPAGGAQALTWAASGCAPQLGRFPAVGQPQTPRLQKGGANSTHWRGWPGCGVEGACEGLSWVPGEGSMTKSETQQPIINSLAAPPLGGRRADSGSILTPNTTTSPSTPSLQTGGP